MEYFRDRELVQRHFSLNCEKLFGPIDDAIRYLQEVRDAHPDKSLEVYEEALGYDGSEYGFTYQRPENREEFTERKHKHEREQRAAKEKADKEQAAMNYENEMAALKRKYKGKF